VNDNIKIIGKGGNSKKDKGKSGPAIILLEKSKRLADISLQTAV